MYGGGIIFSMRSATHHGQVIGFIVGMFFILEVLCMLIFVGAYFTHDFTGVYLTLLADFLLTYPYSYWWVQCSMHSAALQTKQSRHAIPEVWDRRLLPMCANERWCLRVLVSTILILPLKLSPHIYCNFSTSFWYVQSTCERNCG